jgi:hypothetical protein
MPNPINRDSLNIDLATRYSKQKAGGAFDAKNIVTAADTIAPLTEPSSKGQQFTIDKGGFRVGMPIGLSSLADVPDRINSTSKQLSTYSRGLSNKKYKP